MIDEVWVLYNTTSLYLQCSWLVADYFAGDRSGLIVLRQVTVVRRERPGLVVVDRENFLVCLVLHQTRTSTIVRMYLAEYVGTRLAQDGGLVDGAGCARASPLSLSLSSHLSTLR